MILGCAVYLILPPIGRAEVAIAESFAWVLANSDRVVVGKVVKVEEVTGSDKKEYQAVTIAVSKTLKGTHVDRATFLLHHYIPRGYATQWKEEGIPTLFCLVKNDGKQLPFPADKFAWILREDGNNADAVLLGKSRYYWSGRIPVLTREFDVLTDREVILQFVEQTLKSAVKDDPPRSHTLLVPGGTAVSKKLWSGSAVYLVVPIDQKLEALGQRWCRAKSAFQRKKGARILRHFKNNKNTDLLKSLLGDPSTCESTLHRSVPGKVELELVYRKRLYYIQQAAYDALREWGIQVDRPILEELLEGREVAGEKTAEGIR